MGVISLGSNISSIKAQRQLGRATSEVSTIFERLSSGQRINKASDDAAGLAIISSLQSDRKVFTQGIRNYNDGISLFNIADGALEQLSNVVVRLNELAEQAANGTYGTKQRASLNAEAQALAKEYHRIAQSTTFNSRGLFQAGFGELRLQGGYGADGGIQSGLGGSIGTGSFESAITLSISNSGKTPGGNSSANFVLSDFNGDGIPDIAASVFIQSAVEVRLGTGSGTFGSAVQYQVGAEPESVVAADFNGDGIMDLATANYAGARVSIMLGRGDGTFGPTTSFAHTAATSQIDSGDFNGDGLGDIVVAAGTNLSVFLSRGDGTFTNSASINVGHSQRSIAIGDINSDGISDVITANQGGFSASIFTGNSDGSLTSTGSRGVALAATSVELADLNNDGALDLISTGSNGFSVLMGTGSGSFGSPVCFQAGTDTRAIESGDFNGDGNLDLVTSDFAGDSISVLMGKGNGTFNAATSYSTTGNGPEAVAVADMNGDGVPDVVVRGSDNYVQTFLSKTADGVAPILPFSLSTAADARQALPQFQKKLQQLAMHRGEIGAFQSRVTIASNVLEATAENYAAASSRIRDADIAEESSRLVRTQILQKAASAVLAQANQQPALALQLLAD